MPARLRRKAGQTLNWIHPHSTPSPQRGRSFRFSAKRWTGYKNADQKYEHLKQKQPLRYRLKMAWKDTPTKWYPLPIGIGAALLAFLSMRNRNWSTNNEPQVVFDGQAMKLQGPWQVHVIGALPLRQLSRLWGYVNSFEIPIWARPTGFKIYSWLFNCNLDEITPEDLTLYPSLGVFFYRKLKSGARPIAESPLVSPADGTLLHFGTIENAQVEQVKGVTYSLDALLGLTDRASDSLSLYLNEGSPNDPHEHVKHTDFANVNGIEYSLDELLGKQQKEGSTRDAAIEHDLSAAAISHDAKVAQELGRQVIDRAIDSDSDSNSDSDTSNTLSKPTIKPGNKLFFSVIYLAPGDYHRFHSPAAWVAEKRRHFAGDLFSVSPWMAKRLPNLFVLNERVALLGRWTHGFFSMTPVGATNVGSIILNFDKDLRTNVGRRPPRTGAYKEADYARASRVLKGQPLQRGEEMGGFCLGSTVVMVFEAPEEFKFFGNPGLDNAGKTTILYRVTQGEVIATAPTVGSNLEQLEYKNLKFALWDIGGQQQLRSTWSAYYNQAKAIILVVDSCEIDRLAVVKEELHRACQDEQLDDALFIHSFNHIFADTAMSQAQTQTQTQTQMQPPPAPPTPQEVHRKLSMTSAPPKSDDNLNDSFKKSQRRLSQNIPEPVSDSPPSPTFSKHPYLSADDEDHEPLSEEEEVAAMSGSAINGTTINSAHDAPINEENVLRNGYLDKKGGGHRKRWKKRWFVLRPTKLAIYKSDKEYRLLRLIDVSAMHTCVEVDVGKKHNNVFGLVTPDRIFYLKCHSRPDMESWIDAVNMARKFMRESNSLHTSLAINNESSSQLSPVNIPTPAHRRTSLSSTQASPARIETGGFSLTTDGGESPNDRDSTDDDDDDGGLPPTDPNKVILTGYLMKLSKRKAWRKRYWMLTSDKLSYARSHMDKPQRHIPLSKILDTLEAEKQPTSPEGAEQHEHKFKVITVKRTFILSAQSEEEEIRWLSALQTLLAHKRGLPVGDITASPISTINNSHYLGPAPPQLITQPPTPQLHKLVDVPEEDTVAEVLAAEEENEEGDDSEKLNGIGSGNVNGTGLRNALITPNHETQSKHQRTRSGTVEARAAVDAVTKRYHPDDLK
ncbi:hypothetical protein E3P92_03956 [Wallemia ichthyophaga]|uniref:Phosphatidylserine decarboxylase proenzyme 1, mitochondrial n=1 Tax=Wallemia ichthyophaga TaxID=245174 RepID=A0A4T0ETA9_WALIC|nr:hypothetical protein E3P98_03969 [Wallemia ichthyophaga]TIA94941.1 hypothetical protein E3P95_03969 [Wallemia ichthyophaga]TIA95737.1 hypothetical protein E3P94_03953 [Wallemia ichthyophaga]TIB07221.1 hypothetical protein E3P93_03948 [Wallemia ichthyophaga]TIB07713.1 hypothetical protein E3P90_03951 [Wallemia ichthyophaga]